MATYKVIQDIEAEDKLLGPLTLRQFIYAIIVIVLGFVAFQLGRVQIFLMIPFLPPMIFFAMLAAPFGHDQSSEVWLLAKIRFALKPRKRIWDQSGIKDLVTITVPKEIERRLTDGLSQHEVKSRLSALANTLDSRGWVVKNVSVNMYNQPSYLGTSGDDRLVNTMNLPLEVSNVDVTESDDIMDENNNQTAQKFQTMIDQSSQAHRQAITQQMQAQQQTQQAAQTGTDSVQTQPADTSAYWYADPAQQPVVAQVSQTNTTNPIQVPQPLAPAIAATQVAESVTEQPLTTEEQAVLEQIHQEKSKPSPAQGNLKTIQPLSAQAQAPANPQSIVTNDQPPVIQNNTSPLKVNPDIMRLANNDDLNVATIAREANKSTPKAQNNDGEVVISFH